MTTQARRSEPPRPGPTPMRTTPLLLILASQHDAAARALVQRMGGGARLLTPRDLSTAGWCYQPGQPENAKLIAGGQPLDAGELSGVITRLAYVPAQELTDIAPVDRDYVAAEMNAFLISWLSELPCPVLNRPTAGSLCGPSWRQEQWLGTAARLGIPILPLRRTSSVEAPSPPPVMQPGATTVTVVGDTCLGAPNPALAENARRLAGAAGVSLLAVHFSDPGPRGRLVSAHPLPELTSDSALQAVLEHLRAA